MAEIVEVNQVAVGTGVTYFWQNPRWQQQPPGQPRLMSRKGGEYGVEYLYIVLEHGREEPGLIEQRWYPTGENTKRFVFTYGKLPKEGFVAEELLPGEYRVHTGFQELDFPLTEGAKTQAEFIEKRIVPPPKVRSATRLRWRGAHGVWEKSTKSTRWHWVEA